LDNFTRKHNPERLPPLPYTETPTGKRMSDFVGYCDQTADLGMILSEPGAGKTTILHHLAGSMPDAFYIYIAKPEGTASTVLRKLCEALDLWARAERSSLMMAALLHAASRFRKPPIFFIDEAQNLDDMAMEALRALYDQGGFIFIFAANHKVTKRLKRDLPQLESRIGFQMTVEPVRGDIEAIAASVGVAEEAIVRKLWQMSIERNYDGKQFHSLRLPVKVLRCAVALAGRDTAPTVEHVRQAMVTVSGGLA